MQKLIQCQMVQLRDDLHKIIVGDLLQHNRNIVVFDGERAGETFTCLASEDTLDGIIETIAFAISGRDYSLDVRMVSDRMAVIPVRVYAPAIPIEGLI